MHLRDVGASSTTSISTPFTESDQFSGSKPAQGATAPRSATPASCFYVDHRCQTLSPLMLSGNISKLGRLVRARRKDKPASSMSVFSVVASRRGGSAVWSTELQWNLAVALPPALPDVSRQSQQRHPPPRPLGLSSARPDFSPLACAIAWRESTNPCGLIPRGQPVPGPPDDLEMPEWP